MRRRWVALAAFAAGACAFAGALEDGFANPPNENKPRVWWHWMNGNVSKAGITADLEAMAKAGVGGAHLFDVGCDIPAGPVAFNTPAWDEHVTWAAKEAERLGLEITLVNSSGYSSSGGPWVKPEDAMKKVTFSEAVVKGGETFTGVLPPQGKESGFYADVATLAFPLPPSESEGGADATLMSMPIGTNEFLVSASKPYVAYGFTLSITYDVWRWDQAVKAAVWTSDDGKTFVQADVVEDMVCREGHCDCHVENNERKLVAFSKPVKGKFFRVKIDFPHDDPRPIRFEVKHFALDKRTSLAGMNTVTYRLRGNVPETTGQIGRDRVVPLESVVDVTDKLDPATGKVAWTAPKGGLWCLMRIGCAYNGAKCAPASKYGIGPEVDKLDAAAVGRHFDAYVGKFAKLPAIKATLVDSYEVGCQNWTKGLERKFQARWGYSIVPYLACFSGRIVGSVDQSANAFRDFRRVIAELFAENYAGGLRAKCQAAGIELAIEPYGNSPADNTSYAKNVDVPMTEFWVKPGDALTERGPAVNARVVASAAHFWGRKHVDAEAFTAHPNHGGKWLKDPFGLKAVGDWAYAGGVTRMVYHRWAHQPWTEPARLPGMTMGPWGTHFERTETWWPMVGPWLKYQSRCQFLLEQGLPVADLLYYVGDDAPNSGMPANPSKKLAWDAVGADALKALKVANGRLVAPSGATYARLVIPENAHILPESLKELGRLRKAGAVFVYGGRSDDGIMPDVIVYGTEKPVNWIHRTLKDGRELYFVAYGGDDAATIGCSFRQNGRKPEIWDPETGTITPAERWRERNGRAEIEFDVKPCGAFFVVFGKPTKEALPKEIKRVSAPAVARTVSVEGPWALMFPQGWGCPESVPMKTLSSWTTLAGEAKHFSGIATYVYVGEALRAKLGNVAGKRVWLDLGDVKNLAEVTVNGKTYGPLWRPPFRVDVTDALSVGDKVTLSVRVANLWPNRLIGDAKKPMDHEVFTDDWRNGAIKAIPAWVAEGKPSPAGRFTFTTWDHWKASSELLPSGLLGPVAFELTSSASAEESFCCAVTNAGASAMTTVELPLPFRSTRASVSVNGGAWRDVSYVPTPEGRSAFALDLAPGAVARFRVSLYDNADWQICPKSRTPPWNVACPCCDTVAKNAALSRHYREVCRLDAAADAVWEGVKDFAGVARLRAKLRKRFIDSIGGFPERTPLNARVTGVVRRDGYRVEKVLFESEPMHFVTAHLFLPDGASPSAKVPAVLVSCGHSDDGKLCRKYQRISVLAAKAGMAALIFDPIDQGERWQGPKTTPCSPCDGHFAVGKRAHLLGWSQARFRIWDGMRAADYLCARPEIDASRIGVLGQSGGGTLSTYLFALDDRLKVAAPAGFITTMTRLAEHWGPQDSEQTLQGQLVNGLNHLSLLALRAPAPVCLTLVDQDAFPYDGSIATHGKLKALYARLGVPERATYAHEPGTHGYFEGTMRASIDWMRRWLKEDTGPCDYGRVDDFGLHGTAEGNVTPTGFVSDLPGYRSSYAILRDELARRDAARKPFTRADVLRITGIDPDAANAPDDDFTFDAGRMAYFTRIHSVTQEVAAVDWWLGTSYVKERAELFISRAKAFVAANGGAKMPLVVRGDDAVAAAHAAYLRPDLFGKPEIADPPPAWRAGLVDQKLELPMTSLVYGALPVYDWTDLLNALP